MSALSPEELRAVRQAARSKPSNDAEAVLLLAAIFLTPTK